MCVYVCWVWSTRVDLSTFWGIFILAMLVALFIYYLLVSGVVFYYSLVLGYFCSLALGWVSGGFFCVLVSFPFSPFARKGTRPRGHVEASPGLPNQTFRPGSGRDVQKCG